MANSTLANLKIGALRRAGNHYNASDTTLLSLAGGLINDALGLIQSLTPGAIYHLDIGNTVTTTASTAYIALVDTDIIDILNVYQRVSDTKLRRISYPEYVAINPDITNNLGVAEYAYATTQDLNASGQNIFTLYLLSGSSAAITLYYDYIKNMRFSTDGADSEFCALPSIYDAWIYAEFRPMFYQIVDPSNASRIRTAEMQALSARNTFKTMMMSHNDRSEQMGSYAGNLGLISQRVATTADPT